MLDTLLEWPPMVRHTLPELTSRYEKRLSRPRDTRNSPCQRQPTCCASTSLPNSKVDTHCVVSASHTLQVRSPEQVSRRVPSGFQLHAYTPPPWPPWNSPLSVPLSPSNSSTFLSCPALANRAPCLLKRTQFTQRVCWPEMPFFHLKGGPSYQHSVKSSDPLTTRYGLQGRRSHVVICLECPVSWPSEAPVSMENAVPKTSRPLPATTMRFDSTSHARSAMGPLRTFFSNLSLCTVSATVSSVCHTRTTPVWSAEAM
mmetsp:Transcript_16718/g.42746  ORF Transcript_16718/g.42746 Transcript_16718/m.42746 type:complete len:257 (+) Transcript_16718:930-1700(+)